jgi:hypothetical protein
MDKWSRAAALMTQFSVQQRTFSSRFAARYSDELASSAYENR